MRSCCTSTAGVAPVGLHCLAPTATSGTHDQVVATTRRVLATAGNTGTRSRSTRILQCVPGYLLLHVRVATDL